ncbi:MAG: PEPxxWA-CTERM sorting domain-containing protein [Pseudomonadota bacterium]
MGTTAIRILGLALAAAAGVTALPARAQAPTERVVNGTFEAGNSGFQTTYTGNPPGLIQITTNPNQLFGGFASYGDHTTGTGNMLFFDTNGAGPNDYFWQQTLGVAPNSNYALSFWMTNAGPVVNPPLVDVRVDGVSIGQFSPTTSANYVQYTANYTTGALANTATLGFYNLNPGTNFNDATIDDISFMGAAPAVPEPATWGLMIGGFGIAGGALRRRRRGPARRLTPALG